jgi:hypothetical protein
MTVALPSAFVAAAAFFAVASIRSANRHLFLDHPEQGYATALLLWTTLVTAVKGLGWYFLGWALIMVASAGWTSRGIPRPLALLYLFAGAVSLFVYVLPEVEIGIVLLLLALSLWQGIVFWTTGSEEPQVLNELPNRLGPA